MKAAEIYCGADRRQKCFLPRRGRKQTRQLLEKLAMQQMKSMLMSTNRAAEIYCGFSFMLAFFLPILYNRIRPNYA